MRVLMLMLMLVLNIRDALEHVGDRCRCSQSFRFLPCHFIAINVDDGVRNFDPRFSGAELAE